MKCPPLFEIWAKDVDRKTGGVQQQSQTLMAVLNGFKRCLAAGSLRMLMTVFCLTYIGRKVKGLPPVYDSGEKCNVLMLST